MSKGISLKNLQNILNNPKLRKKLAYEDPMWFSLIYLRHHFSCPLAPFHLEMFHLIKSEEYKFVAMMAFRESGKSTIMNMTNVLWSILGKPQRKFAIIISQSQEQAKNQFTNIKDELLNNELLREDSGPYTENEAAWNKMSLELEYHGSKIMSVSIENSIRGSKYHQHRPDLIICDDLEDCAGGTADRPSPYPRFMGEVMPSGNSETKIFVLGNLVSENSLLMQLKKEIETKKRDGIFRAYPLLDDKSQILWPEKFPSIESIEKLKKGFTREVWSREFLLILLIKNLYLLLTMIEEDEKKEKNPDQYPDPPSQIALIPQMAEFKISAPLIIPTMGDSFFEAIEKNYSKDNRDSDNR